MIGCGRWRRAARMGLVLGLSSLVGCQASDDGPAPAWRADCAPISRPPPLSLEAARAAHRRAERHHTLQLREAAAPGYVLREMRAALDPDRVAGGEICLADLAEMGEMVFEHEFGFADGLGGGGAASDPAGPFRRVHAGAFGGPETISCRSCHWVGGPNGAGAETDNAFLLGDGERTTSGDERNPPALVALGVVQALAREMSRDLGEQRQALLGRTGRAGETRLVAKGVDFGTLRVTAAGEVDVSGIEGVDADLVVKPFGWKGIMADVGDFAADALQVHLGIQSDRLVSGASSDALGGGDDPTDPDADGVRDELGRGPFTALVAHLVLLELPIVAPLTQERELGPAAPLLRAPTMTSFADDFRRGRAHFHALGCAGCHVPMLVLESPLLEVDGLPPLDLSREMRDPALRYDPGLGGYPVWLFSDLKRHDMGASNRARHRQRGVPPDEYLTPRLWGVADSAPYLHDGRAPSFDYAIAGHGGEGAAARAAFQELSREEKGALAVYLMSLRRTPRFMIP